MLQKWKSLIFSTSFLTMGSFAAQAMEKENDHVHAICTKYNCAAVGIEQIKSQVKGKIFDLNNLNEYGVPHAYCQAALLFFNTRPTQGYLDLTYFLFQNTPIEKREGLFEYLNAHISMPMLFSSFYIDPEGNAECIHENMLKKMISSQIITENELENVFLHIVKETGMSTMWEKPAIIKKVFKHFQKEKPIISLKEKLLALPYKPHQM